jgi:septum formation protein
MRPLVLASTSSARRALFDQVGLVYEAVSPEVPEPLEKQGDPALQAAAFALAKARAVAASRTDAIVVGADQVLAFSGESWGKPESADAAFEQLSRLAGQTHELVTAVAIVSPGEPDFTACERSRLTVRGLSEDEVRAYVATGEWQGCAGGYRLEGRGLALFERIEGDHTNILGLPMPLVLTRLRSLGVPLFR